MISPLHVPAEGSVIWRSAPHKLLRFYDTTQPKIVTRGRRKKVQRKYTLILLLYFCVFSLSELVCDGYKHHTHLPIERKMEQAAEDEESEYAMHRKPVKIYFDSSVVISITVSVYYVSKAIEKVLLLVLHEPHKNIKQLPRCSIDNRTHVRYNRIIATLVRAVMGGTENGRIQQHIDYA